MKLRFDFSVMEMDGELVAVPVGEGADRLHGSIKLNPVAADIFEQLKEETDPARVHRYLKEKYPDSTDDEIGPFLASFLSKLYREGLLEDKELDAKFMKEAQDRMRQAQEQQAQQPPQNPETKN